MILIDAHIWLRWIIGGESALPVSIQQVLNHEGQLTL